jgi:prefoldin beta subunit
MSLDPELRAAYEEIQKLLADLKEVQGKKTKILEQRRGLGAQQNENQLVKTELDQLEPDARVYKLIGPALVEQSETDAKTIVEKRLEYIGQEIQRTESQVEDVDKKEDAIRSAILVQQERMNKRHQLMQKAQQQQQQQQQQSQ